MISTTLVKFMGATEVALLGCIGFSRTNLVLKKDKSINGR